MSHPLSPWQRAFTANVRFARLPTRQMTSLVTCTTSMMEFMALSTVFCMTINMLHLFHWRFVPKKYEMLHKKLYNLCYIQFCICFLATNWEIDPIKYLGTDLRRFGSGCGELYVARHENRGLVCLWKHGRLHFTSCFNFQRFSHPESAYSCTWKCLVSLKVYHMFFSRIGIAGIRIPAIRLLQTLNQVWF